MPVSPVGAIIGGGLGLAESIVGLINSGKAKKEARELERSRPQYEISPYATDELSLAEGELASGGLSAKAESAYNNLNNQQFASYLDAILKSGGSPNNVSEVFGANEGGRLRLAQLQDQMRLSKIQNLTAARRYYTDQTDKAFLYNEDSPWKDKAQANAEARKNAESMIWSGLGTAGAAGINYATQQNSQDNYNNYLKTFNQPSSGNNGYVKPDYNFGQYSEGGIYGPPTRSDLEQFRIQ